MEYVEKKRILLFGLPWTFTKYTIKDDLITIKAGLLKTVENDCYMYKVQDVEYTETLVEKMFGLGTVICYTGDTTHATLTLERIRHGKEIKNYILKVSEEARVKRRTINTLNIGTEESEEF